MVNPEIVALSEESEEQDEGCLSIPGYYFPLSRSTRVHIRFQELDGTEGEREAEGFLARIFQHETDHLDGTLFITRLERGIRNQVMGVLRQEDFGARDRA